MLVSEMTVAFSSIVNSKSGAVTDNTLVGAFDTALAGFVSSVMFLGGFESVSLAFVTVLNSLNDGNSVDNGDGGDNRDDSADLFNVVLMSRNYGLRDVVMSFFFLNVNLDLNGLFDMTVSFDALACNNLAVLVEVSGHVANSSSVSVARSNVFVLRLNVSSGVDRDVSLEVLNSGDGDS